ncbi:hypothetical protein [Streptomyces sp. SID10815]|uniref:hypothetical protein n=1 Tax=Streptomyces sp. SID10815 TaxID=2706027 RepID=UPI0013CBFF0E|nr:hypothetical protein [Streptomyces sp. SID10815]NEA44806.1 hypothetical protein [Streptomyces sp. SID10815]
MISRRTGERSRTARRDAVVRHVGMSSYGASGCRRTARRDVVVRRGGRRSYGAADLVHGVADRVVRRGGSRGARGERYAVRARTYPRAGKSRDGEAT